MRVHRLFITLMVGDMANQGRIMDRSKELQEVIMARCLAMQAQEKAEAGLAGVEDPLGTLSSEIRLIILSGRRLVWLCESFGTGCLFHLQSTLSEFC